MDLGEYKEEWLEDGKPETLDNETSKKLETGMEHPKHWKMEWNVRNTGKWNGSSEALENGME